VAKFVANDRVFRVRVAPVFKVEIRDTPTEVGVHKYAVNGIEKSVDVAARLRECYGKYVTEFESAPKAEVRKVGK